MIHRSVVRKRVALLLGIPRDTHAAATWLYILDPREYEVIPAVYKKWSVRERKIVNSFPQGSRGQCPLPKLGPVTGA